MIFSDHYTQDEWEAENRVEKLCDSCKVWPAVGPNGTDLELCIDCLADEARELAMEAA